VKPTELWPPRAKNGKLHYCLAADLITKHGDDRFRHCSSAWMKRVEDAELSR